MIASFFALMLFITEPSGGVAAAMLFPLIPKVNYAPADDKGAGGEPTPKDAKSEFRNLVAELKDTMQNQDTETAEAKAKIEEINNRMDELELVSQKMRRSTEAVSGERKSEHYKSFRSAFFNFANGSNRKGLQSSIEVKSGYHPLTEQKSENFVRFDVAAAGALLLPAEMASDILRDITETTPVMSLVRTSQTSAPQKKRPLRTSTPGGTWLEEEGLNPKKKLGYKIVTLTPKKFAARYGFSIEQEEDSAFDLQNELTTAYQEDFDASVGSAVVSGDGNGKPKGMVGNVTNVNSGALTLTSKMIINLQEELKEAYQASGSWLFTRKTRAAIRSLFLTSNNASLQYLWEPDFTKRSPTLLLGNPVFIAREGDLAGDSEGTFSAGQVPILYGDFDKGYELCMRNDMYIIDDPYSESDHFVRNLNIMSRVDGQPMQKEALAQLTITS